MKSKEKPESFCIVPWVNLSVDVNGSIRPCCKFVQPSEKDATNLGNLKTQPLSEIWNSDEMKSLRQDFLDGKKPAGCKACWDEEKSGIKSFRETFVEGRIDPKTPMHLDEVTSPGPMVLDLKLSQKCNFKCRICGPTASSTFMEEDKKHNPHFRMSEENIKYLNGYKFFSRDVDLEWLKLHLANLQHLELYGGEPLMGKENRLLEDLLVQQGYSKNVTLHYNTNASLFDKNLVEKWQHFKKVSLCFSIDDIGKRFEYQRFPGKWEAVEANIQRYLDLQKPNIKFTIFCSVSVFNVFHLAEFIRWSESKFPEIKVLFNLVHSELIFNISVMPEKLKALARPALEKAITEFPNVADQLKGILEFMNGGTSAPNANRLASEINFRDLIRSQVYSDIYPDIWPVLN